MYRRGHYGVSLLVYAPVGFVFVASDRPALAVGGGAAMLWLAMVPDWDQRVPLLSHRGPTHSLAFVLLVGGVGAGIGLGLGGTASAVSAVTRAVVGFGLGTLAILAHLLADVLTPAGVPLLWPLSGRTYSLHVTRADSTVANLALFALGIGTAAVAALAGVRVA